MNFLSNSKCKTYRVILSFLLLLFIILSFSVKQKRNDLQRSNLKGKVKSVREIPYNAVGNAGSVNKGEELFFSDRHYFLSRAFYSVLHVSAENGDEYGELSCLSDKLMIQNNYITFNSQGNIMEQMVYKSAMTVSLKCDYKYDLNENLIECEFHYENKHRDNVLKWIYTTDKAGNIIEVKTDDADLTVSYKYDDNGNLLEKKARDKNSNGNYLYLWTFKYDRDGKMLEKLGGNIKITYKYNEKGFMIEEAAISFSDRISIRGDGISSYTCNEKGDVIKVEKENMRINYVYDSNGNWVKKTLLLNDNPQTIIDRVISYY